MTSTTPTPALPEGMDFPLEGVRVLDLSRVFAGPLCGQVLADFGADVIKVEHPGRGDDTRDWGMRIGKTETTYYNSMNRNKRSITVDLQTPEGVKIIHSLLPQCDVVIQNFKTGGAEKLGLGYEQLKAIKPDLIYCSVSGYDSSGPEAKRPGYDLVIQAEAVMWARLEATATAHAEESPEGALLQLICAMQLCAMHGDMRRGSRIAVEIHSVFEHVTGLPPEVPALAAEKNAGSYLVYGRYATVKADRQKWAAVVRQAQVKLD